MTADASGARLSDAAVAALAVAAGAAIANGYAIQPALARIAHDFDAPVGAVGAVASATMVGYLAGLILLVPLVDRVGSRALVPGQLLALAGALALAAGVPSPPALIAAFFLIGALTTVAAQASAVVGKQSDATRRGARIGTVSAGISCGILLSRFVGGLLTDWIGWRQALLVLAAFVALTAVAVLVLLPATGHASCSGHDTPPARYLASVRDLPRLLRAHPRLRRATAAGALWFFAFNLVWVGLALHLAAPPYRLSPASIGLFGLDGVLGLLVTRPSGVLADRFGGRPVMVAGLGVAAGAALSLTLGLGSPVATAIALALFDAGCFAAQVANQSGVVSIDATRPGLVSAAYLTSYYAAGAVGGVAASSMARLPWALTTMLATVVTATAAIIAAGTDRRDVAVGEL